MARMVQVSTLVLGAETVVTALRAAGYTIPAEADVENLTFKPDGARYAVTWETEVDVPDPE